MILSNLMFTFQGFPPANIIFTGIGVLLLVSVFCRSLARPISIPVTQVAKDARASRGKLIDLFNCIERFFQRLEIYTGITPTTAMTDIIVDIVAEVLTILGIATKEVKRGRLSESILCRSTILDLTDASVQKRISGNWWGTQTSRTACKDWTD
jgi:hypothetical protein